MRGVYYGGGARHRPPSQTHILGKGRHVGVYVSVTPAASGFTDGVLPVVIEFRTLGGLDLRDAQGRELRAIFSSSGVRPTGRLYGGGATRATDVRLR